MKQRPEWFDGQLDLEPDRLVFIDETWTATNMTRSHGRRAPAHVRIVIGIHTGEEPVALALPVLLDESIVAEGDRRVFRCFPMDLRWMVVRSLAYRGAADPQNAEAAASPASGTGQLRHLAMPFDGPSRPVPASVPSLLLPSELPAAVLLALSICSAVRITPQDVASALEQARRQLLASGRGRSAALTLLAGAEGWWLCDAVALAAQL